MIITFFPSCIILSKLEIFSKLPCSLYHCQVLESSSHSQLATTEIALRMIYIHSQDDYAESDIDHSNKRIEIGKEDGKDKEFFSSPMTEKESTISPRRVKGGSVSHHRQGNGHGHGHGHGHNSSSHSIMGPPSGFDFDKLSQEMKVFVASDTLNSLLVASSSNITAETLVLVISM